MPTDPLLSQTEILKREVLDSKIIYSFYCALAPVEYKKIAFCESAKNIWDTLYITYEGTDRAKETQINLLLSQYESFKMKPKESVANMYDIFTDIVNGLAYQGQLVPHALKGNKLLGGLTQQWENMKTSIRETQRIMPLSMNELIGTLQS